MLRCLHRSQNALRSQTSRYGLRHTVAACGRAFNTPLNRHSSTTVDTASRGAFTDRVQPVPVRPSLPLTEVPLTCPGCGAPSQNIDSHAAGYFSSRQKRGRGDKRKQLDDVYAAALARGVLDEARLSEERPTLETGAPVCDRCHNLVNQSVGQSIIHPTTDSIRAIIEESPHKQNHIYHVLDAADFPMSLIPNLTSALELPRLRTQNRRSKSLRYIRDRTAEVSFIITRADLLAPAKEQVDKLMHYMQQVLRDALGRTGKNLRLGNVRMVSSKRGWWTASVKEEIYRRGGAGWLVGKVNVGKSALVEVVYPKGRMDEAAYKKLKAEATREQAEAQRVQQSVQSSDAGLGETSYTPLPQPPTAFEDYDPMGMPEDGPAAISAQQVGDLAAESSPEVTRESSPVPESDNAVAEQDILHKVDEDDYLFDESEDSLLPPLPAETAYPTLPTVSALPGTTASPIRIPFGNGKGELIDLPGIERSMLETHVIPEARKELIMKHRVVPEQLSVKPGQSLLLGGLIRITPKTDDLVFLMYGFLPKALRPHVTSTEKAIAIQTGTCAETGDAYEGNIKSNATEAAKLSIKSAGAFKLRHDVTRVRAGPVTSRVAGKMKPENLPYVVFGSDLLIEGVGWVEIVAQVRRRTMMAAQQKSSYNPFEDGPVLDGAHLPEIEVFSPQGQYIGVRRPMNGWVIGGPKKTPVHAQKPRPRQTVSYHRRVAGGRASPPKANF